jgi:hypothetical protein
MQTISSLEQFLVQFDITDEKLTDHDLEPLLIRGVGLIDRGFLWELSAEGIDPKDAKRIREYYLSLMSELGGIPDRLTQAAKQAWEAKVKHGDVFVVRSPVTEGHIREALSFLVADLFDQPPQILILEGDGRMTLQDSDLAPKLHEAFGGFTFGKDKCWGFAPEDGKPAPSLESILQILH